MFLSPNPSIPILIKMEDKYKFNYNSETDVLESVEDHFFKEFHHFSFDKYFETFATDIYHHIKCIGYSCNSALFSFDSKCLNQVCENFL